MTKYAALLRGISPLNPNMRNDKLRGVFEGLGFTNVKTVISSGNVLFETPQKDSKKLEEMIENAILGQLGFMSTTIIRSREQLQALAAEKPFGEREHTHRTNLTVTFLKNTLPANFASFSNTQHEGYEILGMQEQAIYSIIDLTSAKTPQLMSWLEKQLGKEITTRTWKTVQRILKSFD
jgi:uncharacterized protein (DUF1697 family)